MIQLSYYRLYIVLYIYSLSFLFLAAVGLDTFDFIKLTASTANMYARTITSLMVFIFSYSALIIHHFCLEKIIKINDLHVNKLLWINSFLKRKRKKTLKAKLTKKSYIFFLHVLIMFLIIAPLLIGETTKFFSPNSSIYFYSTQFAIIGAVLRCGMWIPTAIVAKFSLLGWKKRKLELI